MIKDDYYIERIEYDMAMAIVKKYHYLHRVAPCSMAFGLFERKSHLIVGCITYGVSSSSTLLKGICGEDEMHNVYELTRLWIRDGTPKNSESFLIGNTLRQLDKEIIVSFSEKERGHVGTVYQATNFYYCGLSAKFKDPVVEGLENQHHSTFAHGMSNQEIVDKWGDKVKFVERPRKYRYIFFNADRRRKRELLKKLRYPILPYPKGDGVVNTVDQEVPEILVPQQLSLF
jgi:hypothetical protein